MSTKTDARRNTENIEGKKRTNKPSMYINVKIEKLLHDKDKLLERWKEYIQEHGDLDDAREIIS